LALQYPEQQPGHDEANVQPAGQGCPLRRQEGAGGLVGGGGEGSSGVGLPQNPLVQALPSQQSLLVVQATPGPPQQRCPDNAATDPQRKSRQHSPEAPEQTCW
jgi:hypothetical protein